VRIAAWAFVVCTLLGVVGVFVPVVELHVSGVAFAKKGALSLYQASNDSELVRRFIDGYRKGSRRRYGAAILGALEPHAHGRAKNNLDDVHDAMDTLDTVQDDDIVAGARAFKIGLWAFLSLHVIMGLVVFSSVMNNAFRPRSLAIAAACSVLVLAVSLGIHWACGEAVFEANDELGFEITGASIGALLIPIVAALGTIAMIVLVVLRIRTRTDT
jgi:hypothetical protein